MTKLNLQPPISSYAERLKHTPKARSDRGYWTGDRGNSLYCPKNTKVLDALHKFGLSGIPYIDAMLDPRQCRIATICLPHRIQNDIKIFQNVIVYVQSSGIKSITLDMTNGQGI